MPDSVFSTRQISKDYHMGDVVVRALKGVDLELYTGEFDRRSMAPSGVKRMRRSGRLAPTSLPSGPLNFAVLG